MLASLHAFSGFRSWDSFLSVLTTAVLCGLFCGIPVLLVSFAYYSISGRIPAEDNIQQGKKSDDLWKELNRFTLLALGFAAVWIFFVMPSLFPDAKSLWRGKSETAALAERGNPDAQFSLGSSYEHGEGVPKNQVEAAKWYRKAAAAFVPRK